MEWSGVVEYDVAGAELLEMEGRPHHVGASRDERAAATTGVERASRGLDALPIGSRPDAHALPKLWEIDHENSRGRSYAGPYGVTTEARKRSDVMPEPSVRVIATRNAVAVTGGSSTPADTATKTRDPFGKRSR